MAHSFAHSEMVPSIVFIRTIQLNMELNGSKYCYVSQTIQLKISRLFLHR